MRWFLTTGELITEFCAETLLLLFAEFILAGFGAAFLGALEYLTHESYLRADESSCGILSLFVINVSAYYFLVCLNAATGYRGTNLDLALAMGALVALQVLAVAMIGSRRIILQINQANESCNPLLLFSLLLFVPMLRNPPQWRSFDAIPAQSATVSRASAAHPNVLLITCDALAAADMSLYGYSRETTPALERLARRSYIFTKFYSSSDFTTSAVASLLSGTYPWTHRVFQMSGHLQVEMRNQSLPELLRRNGYITAAIVSNPFAHPLTLRVEDSFSCLLRPPASPWLALLNYEEQVRNLLLIQGMQNWLPLGVLDLIGGWFPSLNHAPNADPAEGTALARRFINATQEPYFLWLHLYAPHAPYVVASRFQKGKDRAGPFTTQEQYIWRSPTIKGPYSPDEQPIIDLLRRRYDESILDADAAIGNLLDWIQRTGRNANTLVILTADHGENFSGGFWGHASPDLHYAEVHIPLLISLPNQRFERTLDIPADLTDIAPTVLALLNVAIPPGIEGQALVTQDGESQRSGPAFSMYLAESSIFGPVNRGIISATDGTFRLLWDLESGAERLYDIRSDPQETVNIASSNPERARKLAEAIRDRFGAHLPTATDSSVSRSGRTGKSDP
jgi:arylsulfatase A-like enzyme